MLARCWFIAAIAASTACGASVDGGSLGGDAGSADAGLAADDARPDAAGPPVPAVIITYMGDFVNPLIFVAAQNGDGPWRLLHSTDGYYRFESTGRYGIAYVCSD